MRHICYQDNLVNKFPSNCNDLNFSGSISLTDWYLINIKEEQNGIYRTFLDRLGKNKKKSIFLFSQISITLFKDPYDYSKNAIQSLSVPYLPPVDLHWFFEISIRTEKKFQLEKKIS